MSNSKEEYIKTAKKVWKFYLNGMDKSTIAKELKINRAEVIHIIKYTTSSLFLTENESKNIIYTLLEEKELLLKELDTWKFSNSDAYQNNKKLDEKLTYKRLSEIYINKFDHVKQEQITVDKKYKEFKKWYWGFFVIITFLSFAIGVYLKAYFMKKQNYHKIDISTSWKSQEGDTLYRLLKKN